MATKSQLAMALIVLAFKITTLESTSRNGAKIQRCKVFYHRFFGPSREAFCPDSIAIEQLGLLHLDVVNFGQWFGNHVLFFPQQFAQIDLNPARNSGDRDIIH